CAKDASPKYYYGNAYYSDGLDSW
nr:immunoglobulin heavy chain junction region [Macaca mulatta]MOV41224.1 immunoglobulin heavy chain junction region [Macaca mulatta]MOV41426.1 immunoglobulin heavy chain junction region [Macaca mulatta]MOV42669.1 immunoglobulin heavy chain junction region [Macaca mulatta]MOV43284.1 immunoglobulin heavy chain junction region [Macaca mulatta]